MKNYTVVRRWWQDGVRRSAQRVGLLFLTAIVAQTAGFRVSAAQIDLSWTDNSTNESGFRVERATLTGAFAQIATVAANVTTYADTSVTAGTTYHFRVRAYNAAGDSPYTNTATATLSLSGNQTPTITPIADWTVNGEVGTSAVNFTVSDAETPAASLAVTATSSNATLVPNSNIVLGGGGANRTVRVTPVSGSTGATTITLAVSDGTDSSSIQFTVTVNIVAAGSPPAVGSIPNQASSTGGQVGPITFAVADDAAAAASLSVTASSSNQTLVPNANVVIGGSGAARTVSVFAAPGQSGTATITVTVSDGVNSRTETFLAAFGTALPTASRLLTVSTRLVCRPNLDTLIPGFVVSGTVDKRILLRVVGPTLSGSPFNVSDALPNPRMTLKRWDGTAFVDHAANDDWGASSNLSEIRQVSRDVSAFPLNEGGGDSALLLDLPPGRYTIIADDVSSANGMVVVEMYDADPDDQGSKFVNMSTRGYVGVGGEVAITGFIVSPEGPKTLLIRAVGPGLAAAPFNVPSAMVDPVVDVYRRNEDGTDTLVFNSDNWSDSPDAQQTALIAAQVSAFALADDSKDAAFVGTFPPGAYSVVVRGSNNGTGTELAEIYTVE